MKAKYDVIVLGLGGIGSAIVEHFIVGRLNSSNVCIAGGFSGHGFKFAPVIGEIVADLVTGTSRHDLSLFNPCRFKV